MRKLQTKFRSFLASEESWWAGFALRLVREYGLHEAKPALLALNITSPDPSNPAADVSRLAISSPADILAQESMPAGQREKKLLLLHKVLICLGDLARYKEQYNENGNRPKAGQNGHTDDWKPRRGRGGKKNTNDSREPKPRDYTRAVECYQQARLLIPDNGELIYVFLLLHRPSKLINQQGIRQINWPSWPFGMKIRSARCTIASELYALGNLFPPLAITWPRPCTRFWKVSRPPPKVLHRPSMLSRRPSLFSMQYGI